jgi:hypothetical protein
MIACRPHREPAEGHGAEQPSRLEPHCRGSVTQSDAGSSEPSGLVLFCRRQSAGSFSYATRVWVARTYSLSATARKRPGPKAAGFEIARAGAASRTLAAVSRRAGAGSFAVRGAWLRRPISSGEAAQARGARQRIPRVGVPDALQLSKDGIGESAPDRHDGDQQNFCVRQKATQTEARGTAGATRHQASCRRVIPLCHRLACRPGRNSGPWEEGRRRLPAGDRRSQCLFGGLGGISLGDPAAVVFCHDVSILQQQSCQAGEGGRPDPISPLSRPVRGAVGVVCRGGIPRKECVSGSAWPGRFSDRGRDR